MLSDYRTCKYANHASNLGALIAAELQKHYKIPAFIVDPVTVDNFIDIARISGVPGIERKSRSHALNIIYCVKKAAKELKISIDKSKFIVAHLGSGFSIAAVQNGHIIDVNDALLGMGPFSVERAGSLPISGILDMIYSRGMDRTNLEKILVKESGLKGYLNENQFTLIEQQIEKGNQRANLFVDSMIYQIVKEIGGLYGTFGGDISALILTGGLANSRLVIRKLNKYLSFINPQIVYPNSFELEALALGAWRVLEGTEEPKDYL
jgi:butyrate kinase